MNKLFTITLGIVALGFLSSFFGCTFSKERQMALKITGEVADKYKKKYKLKFCGIAESAPDGKYRDLGINFDYNGLLSKDEGRKLLLEITKDYLDKINSTKSFGQYLVNNPFTGKNVTVNIYLRKPKNGKIYYPKIKIFSFYGDKLHYKYDTPESEKTANYFLVERETLEEARKIIEEQDRVFQHLHK